MPGVLLAPYNNSMRLGQGYNSFLHIPCIYDAVLVQDDNVVVKSAKGANNVSQVVSYSSRFVDKISEVAKSMNISAGSSIKNGGIVGSGVITLDEAKFTSSDLNAIVSVKVVNQSSELLNIATFAPSENLHLTSEKFFQVYGDCYISGFVDGGDLTGVVSARILDVANKAEIERSIKGQVNSAAAAANFTLDSRTSQSSTNASLEQTETTITVSWSGGGQIKSEQEEWTLDSLYRVAAAFPAKVAQCPQRTWAILTPYYHIKSFVEWAEKEQIQVPHFDVAHSYTSDLLDMYMEYKNCVTRIQAVLGSPLKYVISPVSNAININVADLLDARDRFKKQMKEIVRILDRITIHPEEVDQIELNAKVQAPEIWSNRLPILRANAEENGEWSPSQAAAELAKFSFVAEIAPKELNTSVSVPMSTTPNIPVEPVISASSPIVAVPAVTVEPLLSVLCRPEIEQVLNDEERKTILTSDGQKRYQRYRFDRPTGKPGGYAYNDADKLEESMTAVAWPQRIEANLVKWDYRAVVGWITTTFPQMSLTHGNDRGSSTGKLLLEFQPGEYVTKVRVAKGEMLWGYEGIAFLELTTSTGRVESLGNAYGKPIIESSSPTGFPGLKGYFGNAGDVLDRVGCIWGQI